MRGPFYPHLRLEYTILVRELFQASYEEPMFAPIERVVSRRPGLHRSTLRTAKNGHFGVLVRLRLRALFGEKLEQLCAEIKPHVIRSVAFFLAACRHGGVN